MRRFLCRAGLHSWFRQHDRWGQAEVCRYCVAVKACTPGQEPGGSQ